MEFGFTEEQQKLRQEIHDFFMNELPVDYNPSEAGLSRADKASEDFADEFHKKAVAKGYPSAGWPKKYGGLGFSAIEQGIVREEMSYWGVSWTGGMGYGLVAPVILSVGTDEQKQRFVPPIARGEVTCFECFTEPDAGSDEANVKLRAVPDGDYFVLNGQKVFITAWHKPDWLYTLTRTADTIPKNRGLSLFMVPADAEGITYRVLPCLGGVQTCEIFYDNVRVHKDNLIGEINRGFYAAMATFEFERAGGGQEPRRGMQNLVEFCREEERNGKPLIKDPEMREVLAHRAMEMEVTWLSSWYGVFRRSQRQKLGPQSYDNTALLGKKFRPVDGNSMMDMFGLYGQLKDNSDYVKYGGSVSRNWELGHVLHPVGSLEIQQNVIANRGLGLLRIPRQFNTMIAEALTEESR